MSDAGRELMEFAAAERARVAERAERAYADDELREIALAATGMDLLTVGVGLALRRGGQDAARVLLETVLEDVGRRLAKLGARVRLAAEWRDGDGGGAGDTTGR